MECLQKGSATTAEYKTKGKLFPLPIPTHPVTLNRDTHIGSLGHTRLKIIKGTTDTSHRQYYNLYPVPRPINLIACDREFPILLQH